MPTVDFSPIGNGQVFLTASAVPANGGFIYTYQAGTSTAAPTYTTQAGTVPNSNPIQLTPAGMSPTAIWLIRGQAYKFIVTDSLGTQIGPTYDNIPGISDISNAMLWFGNWNGAIAYAVNSVVQSGGNTYIAIVANTNQQPPNANWALIGTDSTGATSYETFTATAGQTLFALSFSYVLGVNQLQIRRNGSWLNITTDYGETSTTSFSLVVPSLAGDIVSAIVIGA